MNLMDHVNCKFLHISSAHLHKMQYITKQFSCRDVWYISLYKASFPRTTTILKLSNKTHKKQINNILSHKEYRVFRYLRPPSTAQLGKGTYQNYIFSWSYINSRLPCKFSWLYRYWPTSGLMFYVSRLSTFSWTISPCIFGVTFQKCPWNHQ